MNITVDMPPIIPVFKYNHPLKKAFNKGLLPKDFKGIYGKKLTKKNVSIEHITPASQGGRTVTSNIFLADKTENSKRGVKPILEVITKQQIIEHLKQFINIKNKFIDGLEYIKIMCKRFSINIREVLND